MDEPVGKIVTDEQGRSVVRLLGELDLLTAGRAATLLRDAIAAARTGEVVLDLTGLRFVDARGLHALAEAARMAQVSGCRLTAESANPGVRRVLDITGLSAVLALA